MEGGGIRHVAAARDSCACPNHRPSFLLLIDLRMSLVIRSVSIGWLACSCLCLSLLRLRVWLARLSYCMLSCLRQRASRHAVLRLVRALRKSQRARAPALYCAVRPRSVVLGRPGVDRASQLESRQEGLGCHQQSCHRAARFGGIVMGCWRWLAIRACMGMGEHICQSPSTEVSDDVTCRPALWANVLVGIGGTLLGRISRGAGRCSGWVGLCPQQVWVSLASSQP